MTVCVFVCDLFEAPCHGVNVKVILAITIWLLFYELCQRTPLFHLILVPKSRPHHNIMPSTTTEATEVVMDVVEEVVVEELQVASGRTRREIDAIMTGAKLDKRDLQPVSQEILFDSKFQQRDFRFLQLDKEILEKIQIGDLLVFRGDDHDSAVLCTDKETYEIKEAETSNSLLLFSDLHMPDVKSSTGSAGSKSPCSSLNSSLNTSDVNDSVIQDDSDGIPYPTVESRMIIEVAHSYLELKKMRPNLSRIRFLLRSSYFNGETTAGSFDDADTTTPVTLNTLLDNVPASEAEILKYIEETRILDIDGTLHLVDDDYLFRIFSQVLNCIDENSWSANEIDKGIVIQTLSSLAKPFFVEKVFCWFFKHVEEPGASSSKVKYTFHEDKVCRFLGETLLKSMGKFNLKDFLKVWQESVPEGLRVNLKQLCGIAVYDEECSPSVIWYLPEFNLPDTLTERLSLLFETKKKWKLDEISPFIEVFTPPSQNVGNLLTKYARSSTVNGTKFYSSKHGK